MTTYLDSGNMTDEEILEWAETGTEDLTSIDELMPLFSGLLRMGRLDLALPLYERLLPMLEDVVGFAYGNLAQWMSWSEAHSIG